MHLPSKKLGVSGSAGFCQLPSWRKSYQVATSTAYNPGRRIRCKEKVRAQGHVAVTVAALLHYKIQSPWEKAV
jgi:hypothetical protein